MIAAPALIGIKPKSRFGPGDEDRAIDRAVLAMRGVNQLLPVIHGERVVAWVRGHAHDRLVDVWWTGNGSIDSIINAQTVNQRMLSTPFGKFNNSATAETQFNWYDWWPTQPFPGDYSGTAFTARQFTETTIGSFPHGGNVSPFTKLMLSGWAVDDGATIAVIVYDRVLSYDGCTVTGALQNMTNTLAAQRYVSAGQGGLQIMVTVQSLLGAANNLSAVSYTDQNGGSGNAVATSTALTMDTTIPTPDSTQPSGMALLYAGAAGNDVLFLPLAAGDSGVQSIQSYTTSGATTGSMCFALVHPIAIIPTPAAAQCGHSDLLRQIASIEPIYDGACLSIVAYTGTSGVLSGINGSLDFVWV